MTTLETSTRQKVKELLARGTKTIAPLWSLENFVAVNPYMGMSAMDFEEAMNFLNKSGGIAPTLPLNFFREALQAGKLKKEDIAEALHVSQGSDAEEVDTFIQKLYEEQETDESAQIKTLVDVASEINGKKWKRFMVDRISLWASAYFDDKQATWKTTQKTSSLFKAWKQEAEIDFSPEAMGLKGFRKQIKAMPGDHLLAAKEALDTLDIPENMLDHYLSSLLLKMNGWAGFAARVDWDARLQGRESNALEEFLAILLVWEVSLKKLLNYADLENHWRQAKSESLGMIALGDMNESLTRQLILQQAYDLANQRQIIASINNQEPTEKKEKTPQVQAVFCIDVRSEVLRRNLEAAHKDIETLGFAGFFGFPVKYKQLGHEEGTDQCPVLLTTSHTINERIPDLEANTKAIDGRKFWAHFNKAIKSFKSGAVSCFSFVSPLGLFFLPKLIADSFGITRPVSHPDRSGLSKRQIADKTVEIEFEMITSEATGIPLKESINMAASALRGMSLTENFAPIVLIAGHGATTTNNPHATGLDCGACGGHSGESNAKVAAAILNDKRVREGLKAHNIDIPNSSVFMAGLHDTTTDNVTVFNPENITSWHAENLAELNQALAIAGEAARKERAKRMNIQGGDISKQVIQRSKDWSQVRPEWGLAGCSSFIVAPRERTAELNLGGKSFMHNYAWKKDKGFGVLELIMTAPMVVTSWINLQYYASTVDNKRFGSGNKTLHNVVGGMGVLEGFAGDLRVGLPMQSVHDGQQYQHEPQRLNVIIEAPVDEMSKILEKHESIRQLCDNQWIFLFAMNDKGKVAYRYIGDLQWEVV
ncbi:YbcC family protein [Ekhidna sp. To15]|uniref:YbcC family protein n=1 Tax=Ekhidna sp. To15 TaxID=3395267 RepID=UPI003F51F1F6